MKRIGSFHCPRWGELIAHAGSYSNGALAVVLASPSGEPMATLSVNTYRPQCSADSRDLPPDCFYMKDWSENEEIVVAAKASGLFIERPDLPPAISGYVCADAWQLVGPPHA